MGSFNWLIESNRWKHLVLAICIGLWANSWYCAEYTGVGVASALEYKDLLYGNKWDWLDWHYLHIRTVTSTIACTIQALALL